MIADQPRLSIGLPVYNGEEFLREALDSILAQTFEDFELIISDNCSTDATEEICREYQAKDKRIYYYRNQENLGAAPNYNRTVELARGEYFKWAADDDVCAPSFLARCVEVLDNDPTVILSYPRTIFTKPDGQKWWEAESVGNLDSEKPHERFQAAISDFWCLEVFGVIRTDALRKTSLISSYYGSDRLLLTQLSLIGRLKEIPESLFFRRCHSDQSSRLSAQEREVWIDTKASMGPKFLRPRNSIEFFRAVFQAPLKWQERIRCLGVLGNYVFSAQTWKKFFHQKAPSKVEQ
ncbi:hypothetical protein BJP34_01190 [Moorena producens PAL-8-15-08-1]|uniref:Glycosyltransferase 2-like domain-containing protein n=1 Tax=Moorena producens PAL-8-15-08-1 TaxID=1458985 RepID=A0A1D8TKQ9_9CYAN|nr:glycosyltransferase family 2 protein [Moorena producens]AOW98240.1 hypothetical protein BJP34_01190 [Moorena producens PAL-8-15-08-1]